MLEKRLQDQIDSLMERYPKLRKIQPSIEEAYLLLEHTYRNNGKLLVAGNGGSAADAEHIVGELMKSFKKQRPIDENLVRRLLEIDRLRGEHLAKSLEKTLTAIPLVDHVALTTAYMNDVDGTGVYAQQLLGYGKPGDVFLGISTSGNSENILNAAITAKAMGMKVIGLTGNDGGKLSGYADVCVKVPESQTYLIQELHLPIYHCWCMMLEDTFF